MSGFTTVGYFLVTLLFDLLLFVLWARIALRYLRVSSLNPFSSMVYNLTNPIMKPIYFLFRYQDTAKQRYDWPVLMLIILAEVIKVMLLSLVALHIIMPIFYTLLYTFADFIIQPCNLLFYALLIRVIMSYVNPHWNHPLSDFLNRLTDPLIKLGRKIIPNISGFDFSPFIMMIILKIITLFIMGSLPLRLL